MLKQQARLVAAVVFLVDLALVAVAFLGAHAVRSFLAPALGLGAARPGLYPLAQYLPLLPLALAIWSALLWTSGRYRSHRRVPLRAEATAIVRLNLLAGGGFAVAVWFFRLDEALLGSDQISRSWIGLFTALSSLLLLVEKLALRLLARRLREHGLNYRTVLLVGAGATARAVARSLREHRWWGYRMLGFLRIDDDANGDREPDPELGECLGGLGEIQSIVVSNAVDEVVFAVPQRHVGRFEAIVLALQDQGILVRFALGALPHARVTVELEEIDGVPLVSLRTVTAGPLGLAAKRVFDLVVAVATLAVALPLFVSIALAIRTLEGGAVFFRQTRCGRNGRAFTLYKFRTMTLDAEARRAEVAHLNRMKGPVFKAPDDPRVTRLGRVLRKFSLDELPQLWNVLRGDMSLVGPRPPIPEEVARYERWQRRRLSMKPGLTCLWQVSGRNQVDFDRWMALDLEYIDNWSLWLDLKILARTVPVVLLGRGAS